MLRSTIKIKNFKLYSSSTKRKTVQSGSFIAIKVCLNGQKWWWTKCEWINVMPIYWNYTWNFNVSWSRNDCKPEWIQTLLKQVWMTHQHHNTLSIQHWGMHSFQFCTQLPYIMHSPYTGKGKAIPLQAWTGPEGSRRLRLPDFDNQHMKMVRLSALRTGHLYPPGNIPGTHFVRGWFHPRAIVWPEGLLLLLVFSPWAGWAGTRAQSGDRYAAF
jgi:hypothetical protein